MSTAEESKRYRERCNERGICQECGHAYAEPGLVRCRSCIEKMLQRKRFKDPDGSKHKQYLRDLREYRRANGICIDCSKKALPGKARCAKHLRSMRESAQAKRIEHRIRKQAVGGF